MARHGDLDPFKVSAVRAFISKAFPPPEYAVSESYDADRGAQIFHISRGDALAHIFGVSREFVADHSTGQIEMLLDEQTTEFIKRRGPDRMSMLTNDGVVDRR
jgi:hypothetical protein